VSYPVASCHPDQSLALRSERQAESRDLLFSIMMIKRSCLLYSGNLETRATASRRVYIETKLCFCSKTFRSRR
jgi:hypothetical protein